MTEKLKKNLIQTNNLNFNFAIKLVFIISFWEAVIMLFLPELNIQSEIITAIIDTVALSLFSSISIWYFLIKPLNIENEKIFRKKYIFLENQLEALDQTACISITDKNGKINYVNKKFCNQTGYSNDEIIGMNHRVINSGYHSKEFFKTIWNTINSGKVWSGQIRNKKKSNEFDWINANIVPLLDENGDLECFVAFGFDITKEKEIEKALEEEKSKNIHMSRLASLGEMASSIAHEINNPLTVISSLNNKNKRKLTDGVILSEIKDSMSSFEKIEKNINRITKIISNLRNFSHHGEITDSELVQSNTIIENVLSLCHEKIKMSGVEIKINQTENLSVYCNSIQIEQVLVNLLNNSLDAISSLPEKWINIFIMKNSENIEFIVTDSGNGIPEKIAEKMMQPFFTSKPVGKGTGLGLSISKSIIEKHGGQLVLDHKNKNTSFIIRLPIKQEDKNQLLDLDDMITAHLDWNKKILNILYSKETSLNNMNLEKDDKCALGKWIINNESKYSGYTSFDHLKKCHTDLHKYVGQLFIKSSDNFNSNLLEAGTEFDEFSKNLIFAIQELKSEIAGKKVA